jgi:hypothetical protein
MGKGSLCELAEDALYLAVDSLQDLQLLLYFIAASLHFCHGLLLALLPHGLLIIGQDLPLYFAGITYLLNPLLQFLVPLVYLTQGLTLAL